MNYRYVYKDGKAFIINDNEKTEEREYIDNLDEVLVKENLIEMIEKQIEELEKETNNKKRESIFSKIEPWYPLLLTTIVPLILFQSGLGELYIDSEIISEANSFLSGGYLFSLLLSPLGMCFSIPEYKRYKYRKNNLNGKKAELEYLKQTLKKEKENIENLQQDKNNSKDSKDFYISKVDDCKEELNSLSNNLSVYYDLGYNEDKYIKYFNKNKLEKKLSKHYDAEELEIAKEYVATKSENSTKRRVRKR